MGLETTPTQTRLRIDTAANWIEWNVVLADGEVGIERDTRKSKTGDGLTAWIDLEYDSAEVDLSDYATIEYVDEAVGGIDLSSYATTSAVAAGYQPLDSDLTNIAALTTTTFGRALLTQSDAAATRSTIGLGAASSPSFTGLTAAGTVAANSVASQSYASANPSLVTTTTGTHANTATTINVASTAGFPVAGMIMIWDELIAYTGRTATSFTGCTRGRYSSPVPGSISSNVNVYSVFINADVSGGFFVCKGDSSSCVGIGTAPTRNHALAVGPGGILLVGGSALTPGVGASWYGGASSLAGTQVCTGYAGQVFQHQGFVNQGFVFRNVAGTSLFEIESNGDRAFLRNRLTSLGGIDPPAVTFSVLNATTATANLGERRITDRGNRRAYPDGTNWRFTADDAIIS
jgi:hypothetical protein